MRIRVVPKCGQLLVSRVVAILTSFICYPTALVAIRCLPFVLDHFMRKLGDSSDLQNLSAARETRSAFLTVLRAGCFCHQCPITGNVRQNRNDFAFGIRTRRIQAYSDSFSGAFARCLFFDDPFTKNVLIVGGNRQGFALTAIHARIDCFPALRMSRRYNYVPFVPLMLSGLTMPAFTIPNMHIPIVFLPITVNVLCRFFHRSKPFRTAQSAEVESLPFGHMRRLFNHLVKYPIVQALDFNVDRNAQHLSVACLVRKHYRLYSRFSGIVSGHSRNRDERRHAVLVCQPKLNVHQIQRLSVCHFDGRRLMRNGNARIYVAVYARRIILHQSVLWPLLRGHISRIRTSVSVKSNAMTYGCAYHGKLCTCSTERSSADYQRLLRRGCTPITDQQAAGELKILVIRIIFIPRIIEYQLTHVDVRIHDQIVLQHATVNLTHKSTDRQKISFSHEVIVARSRTVVLISEPQALTILYPTTIVSNHASDRFLVCRIIIRACIFKYHLRAFNRTIIDSSAVSSCQYANFLERAVLRIQFYDDVSQCQILDNRLPTYLSKESQMGGACLFDRHIGYRIAVSVKRSPEIRKTEIGRGCVCINIRDQLVRRCGIVILCRGQILHGPDQVRCAIYTVSTGKEAIAGGKAITGNGVFPIFHQNPKGTILTLHNLYLTVRL